ncbi:MAG: T9SS type A sorting domain-containing protein [Bacteroidetes bacterium]|nr:T9SS type A sorting domain-containing protein [Bacteroidota bacterium]
MHNNLKYLILGFAFLWNMNSLFAWTSSNEGVCYTMDTLVQLSPDISYNTNDEMYEVDCDIVILENDTLKILPGETVKFFSYAIPYTVKRGIKIYGCLIAEGEPDNRIHLGDPEATFIPGSGDRWNGIEFYNTSTDGESILKYCTLRAGTHLDEFKETAIFCENSSPIIDHCTIKYMGTGVEEYGCSAVGIKGLSYPLISYCTFEKIMRGIAVWCNVYGFVQDTLNYPSPLIYGCNIMSNVQSFSGGPCDYDIVILYGGFLDNCFLGFWSTYADTTLGNPIDSIGDGICSTKSTNVIQQKYFMVDGVVNPRGDTLLTGINTDETNILPTTTKFLTLKENYPNPFTNHTTIAFEIKKEKSTLNLVVIDSKGNLVKTLLSNQTFSKGKHEVKWFGDNDAGQKVPEGIYFYKLVSGNELLVKKAIVVK